MTSLATQQPERPEEPVGDVQLVELSIETGPNRAPKAIIRLMDEKNWLWDDVSLGNGPVDAAIKAIDRRLGIEGKVKLEAMMTMSRNGEEGSEAMAESYMRVCEVAADTGEEGAEKTCPREALGKAANPDMVRATIEAYIDAVNSLRRQGVSA